MVSSRSKLLPVSFAALVLLFSVLIDVDVWLRARVVFLVFVVWTLLLAWRSRAGGPRSLFLMLKPNGRGLRSFNLFTFFPAAAAYSSILFIEEKLLAGASLLGYGLFLCITMLVIQEWLLYVRGR